MTMLLRYCTKYVSKFGKCSSGHRTGKCLFSSQSAKREVPKNAQTNRQLHSFCMQVNSRKTSTSSSLTILKPLTVWITKSCGKFLKRWEYQSNFTCLLRNMYGGQEASARTGHGTTDWFKIGKGI